MKRTKDAVLDVDIQDVLPNTWNPNHMKPEVFEKLSYNIKKALDKGTTVPPIIVRPHPQGNTKYEIIDGEHRWRVFLDLSRKTIPILVLKDISTEEAKLLTVNLNYLKGEYKEEEYALVLLDLIKDSDTTIEDLSLAINESSEDIQVLLDKFELEVPVIDDLESTPQINEDRILERDKDQDEYEEINFVVPKEVAVMLHSELSRIQNLMIHKEKAPTLYGALKLLAKRSEYLGDTYVD